MDIFEFAELEPVREARTPRSGLIADDYADQRKPVLLTDFVDHWSCGKRWTLDYIGDGVGDVKISRPSADGIYRYHAFEWIPFAQFSRILESTGDVYVGLDPIYRANEKPYVSRSLRKLADDLEVPPMIDPRKIRSVNLWIGPGDNKTLLHYDPWDGLLILLRGRKRLALFAPEETAKLHGYSAFDLKSIFAHKVVDSRINPADLDTTAHASVGRARGYVVDLRAGQAIYIPAGWWHYVESQDVNVAVNFFYRRAPWYEHLRRPLVEYRVKRVIIVATAAVWCFARDFLLPKAISDKVRRHSPST